MIYHAAQVRRLCTKFQVNTVRQKIKIFILGGHFFLGGGGVLGTGIGLRSISNLD